MLSAPHFSMRFLKISTLFLLPFFTLVLGVGIGAMYQSRIYSVQQNRVNQLLEGTGTGALLTSDPEETVDISMLWTVWRLLQRNYLLPSTLDPSRMVYGAISGLVASLGDPYTLFMTPQDTVAFEDSLAGNLEGIGAELEMRNGEVIVVAPLKSSPADRAGIRSKDSIVKVDDTLVEGKSLTDTVKLIRGPKGTTVTLTIRRPGEDAPMVFSVVRENIHVPSVESRVLTATGGTLGLVTLNQFGDDSMREVRDALSAFPPDIDGVVLDLRYNGGGYLDGAVDLVSMFVATGAVVSVERRDAPKDVQIVHGNPLIPTLPLVVLINGGSASASEITAGALQDHKRAKILGTQSFGKGTVQEVLDLSGGASLRVTIAKWITPAGQDIATKGIVPDFTVDRTAEDIQLGRDPQLDAAMLYILQGVTPSSIK